MQTIETTGALTGIPQCFRSYAHWVAWRFEEREGKLTKVPCDPNTGRRASTTDSRTWASFPEAVEALEAGGYDGLGFVFSSGDPFVGIDIDACRNPKTGEVSEHVLEYIRRFDDPYVEVSVSGTGIHIITRGKLRGGAKSGGREIYDQERFFVMTGKVLNV